MAIARAAHVAILLRDGRVLVAGGSSSDGSCKDPSVAELYDPSIGAWSTTSKVPVGIGLHPGMSALPDQRIILIPAAPCEKSAALAFDPSTNEWQTIGEIPETLDRRIDPTPDSIDHLDVKLADYTATRLLNGTILVAGGRDASGPTRAASIHVPQISFEWTAMVGVVPSGGFGRAWGIASSPRGQLFISSAALGTTTVQTQSIEWERPPVSSARRLPATSASLKFVKELGATGSKFVHAVRVDREGNVWQVDQQANTIEKFSGSGQLLARFFRARRSPGDADDAVAPLPDEYVFKWPADIAWDPAGDIFVADAGKSRIVKYAPDGRYLASVGSFGTQPGQFKMPHSIAADAAGNVYVADHGNARIQVFDKDLAPRAIFDWVGKPWAICITPGSPEYLYVSTNEEREPETESEHEADVYKLQLHGRIVGILRSSTQSTYAIRTIHALDCPGQNELYAAATPTSYVLRVQPGRD